MAKAKLSGPLQDLKRALEEQALRRRMENKLFRLSMSRSSVNGFHVKIRYVRGYKARDLAMQHLHNGWSVKVDPISG